MAKPKKYEIKECKTKMLALAMPSCIRLKRTAVGI